MIETERKKVGLKKGAVPSIFPNCPSYLTDTIVSCQRLSLSDKEEEGMHEAYQKSLDKFKETKFFISTLNCIHSKLPLVDRIITPGQTTYRELWLSVRSNFQDPE